ncbi:MAG: cytochrome c3 family protein [Nitrospiraceae bacterium]
MIVWRGILIVLVTGTVAGIFGFLYSTGSADLTVQDKQPIDFSHRLHAGRLNINCLFCHRHAEASPIATIPTVSLCMSCHRSLSDQTTETEKLLTHWTEHKPIEWVRLQRLPDFVYFTHEMHLKAGLECMNCHGRVTEIRHTPRAATYEMGWCLSCHRDRGAPVDCLTCHK